MKRYVYIVKKLLSVIETKRTVNVSNQYFHNKVSSCHLHSLFVSIFKMSIICITEHDESIYKSTKPPLSFRTKSPRYKSIYKEWLELEKKEKKRQIKGHASMGLPHIPSPDPCQYLKKKTGKPALPLHVEKPPPRVKVPMIPVPVRDQVLKEQDEKLKHKKRDYITLNIKNVLKMKPKIPDKKVVIDRYGEAKFLEQGLEPKFIHCSVFGKTPDYLNQMIKSKEKMMQAKKDKIGLKQPKCRYITRDEREKLLAGLKKNWEELQKQYQGLPILTDTIPKINRKSKMEAELKQLEKDIVLVERHPYIYVYEDDELS